MLHKANLCLNQLAYSDTYFIYPSRKGAIILKHFIRGAASLLALCFIFTAAYQPSSDAEPTAVQASALSETIPELKLVALTFDDGPSSSVTPRLLDGLAARGVHATFFLIGNRIEGNEALIKRIEDEGHQVGIHTYSHVPITGLTPQQLDRQIGRTRRLLTNILGKEDFPVRPPFGFVDKCVINCSRAPIILWSVDPKDWCDQNSQRVTSEIVSKVHPGDVVLLHDIFSSTVDATLEAVDQLHQQGYYFVTVEELYHAYGLPLKNGTIYRCAPDER